MEHVSINLYKTLYLNSSKVAFNFRLSGILVNLQTRSKRSTDPEDIATILPNNEICFAGHKLIFKVPSDLKEAEKVREALNTFILMMSHLHGGHSGYYKTI